MGAILPLHAFVVHQAHVGFVDQGGRLQCVAWALALHIAVGQAAEFVVNDRRQAIERALVSIAPGAQEPCHFASVQLLWHMRLPDLCPMIIRPHRLQ